MATDHEHRVRERAYHLWRSSGSEHGSEMEHWLQAEREEMAAARKVAEAPAGSKSSPPLGKAKTAPKTGRPPAVAKKPVVAKPVAAKAGPRAAGRRA